MDSWQPAVFVHPLGFEPRLVQAMLHDEGVALPLTLTLDPLCVALSLHRVGSDSCNDRVGLFCGMYLKKLD